MTTLFESVRRRRFDFIFMKRDFNFMAVRGSSLLSNAIFTLLMMHITVMYDYAVPNAVP
jgi:hypothetical protein